MTGLNEEMCRQIAQAGGGAYIHVENNSSAQEQLDSELDKLAKNETSSTIYSDYDEQFQAVGWIVLFLLIIEICLAEVKNPLLRNVSLFKRTRKVTLLLLALLTVTAASAQTDRRLVRQGNKQFRAGNYADAEVAYRKAIEKNPRNPQANYNLGNALFGQRKDSSAVSQFEAAAKLESSPMRRAQAFHNMGVVCQGKKMYGEAIEAYKEALRLNPADDQTRYNLAVCKRQQKQQQQDQQQQQKQDKDQQDKQDQQQQQQQQQQPQQDQQQQQQEERQPQMSRENAEQMLNAAIQEEKATQERMEKAKQQSQKRRLEKNW